jgi:DNA-binding response OmpR family regulator
MHVLVVEDERKIASYVKRGLEERGRAVNIAYACVRALLPG